MDIITVTAPGPDLDAVRDLFIEYAGSQNFSLCFQDFESEFEGLPGAYAAPAGTLLLARVDGAVAGCAGVRRLDAGRCEMKRLYLRGPFRGGGRGRALAGGGDRICTQRGLRTHGAGYIAADGCSDAFVS